MMMFINSVVQKKTEKLLRRIRWGWHMFRHGKLPGKSINAFQPLSDRDLAEIQSFFSMPKFFIFGHARSGTTLLSRLIRLHPEIHTNRLGHFFTYREGVFTLISTPAAQKWLQRPSKYWNEGEDISLKMLRSICDFILENDAKKHGKNIVGDKSNNNIINGEAVTRLKLVYPDAKLIFIVRDGRDAILSQQFRFFIELPKYLDKNGLAIRDQLADDPTPFLDGNESVFTKNSIQRMVLNWAENVRDTHALGEKLFDSSYISLRFEDLISEPVNVLINLWKFLGVTDINSEAEQNILQEMKRNPDARWQKEQSSRIIDNLEKGRTGTWQKLFNERDKKVFKNLAGQELIDWDYEEDMNW